MWLAQSLIEDASKELMIIIQTHSHPLVCVRGCVWVLSDVQAVSSDQSVPSFAVLLRAEEEVGVHLSTIPRLSATGTSSSIICAMVMFVAPVYPEAHFLCLSLTSEYLGKSPGPSVQRWVPSRSTRRDVNTSNEKERHDAIFRKVRGWVSAWQK